MVGNNIEPVTDPIIINNPMYILSKGFEPALEREAESLLSMGNGYIGTRNSLEEYYKFSDVSTFVAGFYELVLDTNCNALIEVPDWTRIQVFIDGIQVNLFDEKYIKHYRYIDLNNGLYVRNWVTVDSLGRTTNIRIIKFISLKSKNQAFKSITIKPENYSGCIKVISGIDGTLTDLDYFVSKESISSSNICLAAKAKHTKNTISISQKSQFLHDNNYVDPSQYNYQNRTEEKLAMEQWEWNAELNNFYKINSIVEVYTDIDNNNTEEQGRSLINNFDSGIFEACLDSHVEKFQARWEESEIIIDGDNNAMFGINFALYHLIISGEFSGNKVSIPARGLTGEAYQGHIFWDTEIFILPFYIFTKPDIARKLLLYRYNTLDTARENAIKSQASGADYPWESTDTGAEMAPEGVVLPEGEIISIYSGQYENHISPDIAYAVWQYWLATQDEDFLLNYGAEIIFETARYGRSLFKKSSDNLYHIGPIIGPDEYHEKIDDNAYTNLMIQYNLEIAVKVANIINTLNKEKFECLKEKIKLTNTELEDWRYVEDRVYSGYDLGSKLFEQFRGYFDLEYINLPDYEPRSAPMDVILGREETEKTQVIKQADVVMFLFLLANKFDLNIVEENYNYYEKRTGHGSSLSPSIHSLVAARLGKTDLAYKYFMQNIEIDFADKMGNASGGVHMAAQGGTWLLTVMGFSGMYVHENGLLFDPHLPEKWKKIQFHVYWRSCKVELQISMSQIEIYVIGNTNIEISVGFDNWKTLESDNLYSAVKKEKWGWVEKDK